MGEGRIIMTSNGIMQLIQYQKSYFGGEWKRSVGDTKEAQIASTLMEAFRKYEDDRVLKAYQSAVLDGKWERMPSVPQIMSLLGRDTGTYRCVLCNLPWDTGHGRYDDKKRGQIRCPNCNAILEHPVTWAEDIEF